jgi:opacity protein-like surface antigen
MRTRNKKLPARRLILLVAIMTVTACSGRTYAQGQRDSGQTSDLPGLKDFENYYPYLYPDAERTDLTYPGGDPISDHPWVDSDWKKSSRGNYYLNLGLQYKPGNDLTIGITGYNLLGIFNKDLNKRNYIADSSGDFRSHAAAVGVWLEYKF